MIQSCIPSQCPYGTIRSLSMMSFTTLGKGIVCICGDIIPTQLNLDMIGIRSHHNCIRHCIENVANLSIETPCIDRA